MRGMDPGPVGHAVRVAEPLPQLAKLDRFDEVLDAGVGGDVSRADVLIVVVLNVGIDFQDVNDVDFFGVGFDVELDLKHKDIYLKTAAAATWHGGDLRTTKARVLTL